MAESVGLPVLMEVAKSMIEVITNRLTEEMRCISMVGFRRELTNLQRKIRIIKGIIDSMTTVVPKGAVEEWLKDTIRIICNAEDMMDVLAYEKHRSVVAKRRRRQSKALFVFLPLKRVYLRTKMGRWIRSINTDIGKVRKQARFIKDLKDLLELPAPININDNDNDNDQHQPLQQLRQLPDTSLFVGRDSEVASLVNVLTNPDHSLSSINQLPVVAIVGFGGIGKTTLAKKICENDLVLSHFSERIWISDLRPFNINKILNGMVKILEMKNCEDINEVAIRKLKERLGGKRYLLVLDDVWDASQDLWNSLRNTLENIGGSNESMILTTTRSDSVALAMDAYQVRHLSGLSKDDSWSLFEQIAFANWSKGEAFALKATGEKIVEKCNGVPLAIRSIAGMLRTKRNLYDWTSIEENEQWDIQHRDENGVLPSLKLSYNHLSPKLKKCFSLCAFLPKGWWFDKYELICRWMALGLIQNSSNHTGTMEDNGEEYLQELLSISFLLVKKRNELGEATSYILHDLVYDLARSVAMHERLYLEACKKENQVVDIQHLTIYGYTKTDFPEKKMLKNVRSLDIWHYVPATTLLLQVKYLRVLHLGHSDIEVVPESIATLRCLKFLDLEYNPIKVLPDCIMKLYNLQSLFVYECKSLFELPRGLNNLVDLRHLGLSFHLCLTEEGVIGQLNQLQTVPPLELSEGGFQISELGSLHNVKGTLDIRGLELVKSKSDAENSKLSMKPRVEQLRLRWDNDDNFIKHEEVLEGLYPSPNLKLLSIRGYAGDKFPSWLMKMNVSKDHNNENAGSLCNLIKIELVDCGRCQQLPILGHLPSLKEIKIANMENLKLIGPEFYGSADLLSGNSNQASSSGSGSSLHEKSMAIFAMLKELRLEGLGELEEWWEPGQGKWTGFPSLEVLVIEECQSLKKAPNEFPNLRELIVNDMISNRPLRNILSNKSSLSCLRKLDIQRVEELAYIPEEVGECCTFLQTLLIKNCPMFTALPSRLSNLLSLEVLKIIWCPNLTSLPNLSCLCCLRELCLLRNEGLMAAPEGLQSCKSLEQLEIAACGKVETPPDLSGLSRLRVLSIRGMTKMISTQPQDWLYNLPCLKILAIGSYEELDEFPDIRCLLQMTSLQYLHVFGWEKLQSLPQQLEQFTALKELGFFDFENVEHLPDWLGNLTSLNMLCPTRCEKLKKLPSKEALDRLTNLACLEVEDCFLLEQAIGKNGAEYHKIANRPFEVRIINSDT